MMNITMSDDDDHHHLSSGEREELVEAVVSKLVEREEIVEAVSSKLASMIIGRTSEDTTARGLVVGFTWLGKDVNNRMQPHVHIPRGPPFIGPNERVNYSAYIELLEAEPPPLNWLWDHYSRACNRCRAPFTALTRRKHHCRFCGLIFCRDCLNGSCLLPVKFREKNPQRVCPAYYDKLDPLQGVLINTISNAVQPRDVVIDYVCTGGWIDYPVGLSLEYEISKSSKMLRNYCQVARVNPERSIPAAVIKGAKGLAILSVTKIEEPVTHRFGTGLLVARRQDGTWSAPSAIISAGPGWGPRLQGELTEYLIVLRDSKALVTFCSHMHISFGADCSAAAGPIGRVLEADLQASDKESGMCYTYSCSKGAFVGVSFEGNIVATRMDANIWFYADPDLTTITDILLGTVDRANDVEPMYAALEEFYSTFVPQAAREETTAPGSVVAFTWLGKNEDDYMRPAVHIPGGRPFIRRHGLINYSAYNEVLESEPPEWFCDNSTEVCMQCKAPFTALTRRRHHCRFCGRIICWTCSNRRCLLPVKFRERTPQRVCHTCYGTLHPLQGVLINTISNAVQVKDVVIDWTCIYKGWFICPIGLSLAYEISKCSKTLRNYCQVARVNTERTLPAAVLKEAKGLAILSVTTKSEKKITYKFGTGLVVARKEDGSWSAPSAIISAGPGWGPRVGGELTEYLIVLRDSEALNTFCSRMHFTFGADCSAAAGPVGRVLETDLLAGDKGSGMCYTYGYSKGAFVGVSFEGNIVATRMDANFQFYGNPCLRTSDILLGTVYKPNTAQHMYAALDDLCSTIVSNAAWEDRYSRHSAASCSDTPARSLTEFLSQLDDDVHVMLG